MGCGHPSNRKANKPGQPNEAQDQVKVSPINPQGNFQVTASDFVRSKDTKLKMEYNLEAKIEKGSQGKVKKAIHKATGVARAVKIVRKKDLTAAEKERLISEMIIMSKLDHPNIARVYEVFETKNKFCIVTEYCEGGDVFEKVLEISNFSEKEAAKIMKQVLSAVFYCHLNNIAHRDVKPENLVYETKSKDSNIKLVDFDCARSFDPKKNMTELHGTPYYIAPEVLKKSYTEKCDIWSCGVVLYILLSGIPPFSGETNAEIFDKISIGNYHFNYKVWESVSEEAKQFIRNMLEHDPKKRLSAEKALQDPWLVAATQDEQGKFDHPIATENLQSLQNFGFKTKFQEATWAFLVSNFATKSEKQKLLQTFKALDQNGDGQLTKEDLTKGFVKIMKMSEEEAQAEAERIISGLDANASGKIDYSEFVNATISKKNLLKKSKLEAAFKQFDRNGDGKISGDEIKFMFNQGKVSGLPEETWNEWIAQVDKNGDGTLSLEEFKEMMMGWVPKSRNVL